MDSLEQILRPILQPVTRALPGPIRDLGISLLGPKCYISLADNINLSDTECLKLGISKGLGIGIIGASSVVKIPQLLKLLNSQSAEGLSFLSYFLETASYLITLAYNVRQGFPFSTYGEIALIAVQNIAIAVLILRFTGQGAGAAAFVAGLAAAGYALFSEGVIDNKMLGYAQAGAGMLGVASKLPQIVAVFNQGGTGQLSAFAVFNYLAGSLTRIFTTLQEVDDKLILYGFIAGFTLNLILAAQMVYYWNSPTSKATPAHKLNQSGKQAVRETAKDAKQTTKEKIEPLTFTNIAPQSFSSGNASQTKSPSTRRRG